MKCENCGGRCEWVGPLLYPTGTRCMKCGASNTADIHADGDDCEDDLNEH